MQLVERRGWNDPREASNSTYVEAHKCTQTPRQRRDRERSRTTPDRVHVVRVRLAHMARLRREQAVYAEFRPDVGDLSAARRVAHEAASDSPEHRIHRRRGAVEMHAYSDSTGVQPATGDDRSEPDANGPRRKRGHRACVGAAARDSAAAHCRGGLGSDPCGACSARPQAWRHRAPIPNGLDFSRWASSSRPKAAVRRELALPNGILVTCTGRLSKAEGRGGALC
jgi:hypothetical protein